MNQMSPIETTPAELRSTEPLPPEPMTAELRVQRLYNRTYADLAGQMVAFAVVIAIFCVYVFNLPAIFNRNSPPTSVGGLQRVATDNVHFASYADDVFAQVRWREFKLQLEGVLESVNETSALLEKFSRQTADVMRSDDGRRIASDDGLVDQLSSLLSFPRPEIGQLKAAQLDCVELLKVCERAANSENLMIRPDSSQSDLADNLEKRTLLASEQTKECLAGYDALIRASAGLQIKTRTLAAAIEEREQFHQQELLKRSKAERKLLATNREFQQDAQELRLLDAVAKTQRQKEILREAKAKLREEREKNDPKRPEIMIYERE